MNRLIAWLASWRAIVLVPILCVILAHFLSDTALTLVLSIASITICQIVLQAGERDTRAMQRKLDALVEVTDAPNDLIGIERASA